MHIKQGFRIKDQINKEHLNSGAIHFIWSREELLKVSGEHICYINNYDSFTEDKFPLLLIDAHKIIEPIAMGTILKSIIDCLSNTKNIAVTPYLYNVTNMVHKFSVVLLGNNELGVYCHLVIDNKPIDHHINNTGFLTMAGEAFYEKNLLKFNGSLGIKQYNLNLAMFILPSRVYFYFSLPDFIKPEEKSEGLSQLVIV